MTGKQNGFDGFDISPALDKLTPDMTMEDLEIQTDILDTAVKQEQQRTERAIQGAVRAGYDGVDIHRQPPHKLATQPLDSVSFGIKSIEPWQRPPPDSNNGYQTTRYTWDWFSDDELTDILREH